MIQEQPHLDKHEWRDAQRVIQVFGIGYVWYEKYIQSLIYLDSVLFVCSLIPLISHVYFGPLSYTNQNIDITSSSTNTTSTSNGLGPYIFYLVTSSYTRDSYPFLYTYLALHLLCIIIHPICYHIYLRHQQKPEQSLEDPFQTEILFLASQDNLTSSYFQKKVKGEEYKIDIELLETNPSTVSNVLPKNDNQTSVLPADTFRLMIEFSWNRLWTKYKWNLLSFLCFFIILAIYGVCIWAIQIYMYQYFRSQSVNSNLNVSIWISLVLASVQSITDLVWMVVSELLRFLEVHHSAETANRWECMRLFVLRIFSFNMFYFIRTSVLKNQEQCSASMLGVQHTLIVISYILGDLMADYVWPLLYRWYKRKRGGVYGRDYDTWYEYKLSERYPIVASRHILLSCGSSFIPGLALLALFGNVVQMKLDRYLLTHLCRVTHRFSSPYQSFLSLLGVLTVLCFMLGYPKGVLFLFIDESSFFTCDQLSTT